MATQDSSVKDKVEKIMRTIQRDCADLDAMRKGSHNINEDNIIDVYSRLHHTLIRDENDPTKHALQAHKSNDPVQQMNRLITDKRCAIDVGGFRSAHHLKLAAGEALRTFMKSADNVKKLEAWLERQFAQEENNEFQDLPYEEKIKRRQRTLVAAISTTEPTMQTWSLDPATNHVCRKETNCVALACIFNPDSRYGFSVQSVYPYSRASISTQKQVVREMANDTPGGINALETVRQTEAYERTSPAGKTFLEKIVQDDTSFDRIVYRRPNERRGSVMSLYGHTPDNRKYRVDVYDSGRMERASAYWIHEVTPDRPWGNDKNGNPITNDRAIIDKVLPSEQKDELASICRSITAKRRESGLSKFDRYDYRQESVRYIDFGLDFNGG